MTAATQSPLGGLVDIIRRHHNTSAYAGCVIRVHPTALDAIRANSVPAPEWLPWEPDLGAFGRLPLILDEDLPTGGWELRRVQDQDFARRRLPASQRAELLIAKGVVSEDGVIT